MKLNNINKSITLCDKKARILKSETDLELSRLLIDRATEADKDFEWTPENKAKFVRLNTLLEQTLNQCRAEMWAQYEILRERQKKGDFLTGFEISASIVPLLDEHCEQDFQIFDALTSQDTWRDYILYIHDNGKHNLGYSKENIYFSKEMNWNTATPGFRGEDMADVYVNYYFHELCDHQHWSLSDLMKIKEFFVDVKVNLQTETKV